MIGAVADGADHREGGVQDERGIIGLDDKLIGGADLDGAVIPETTTDARKDGIGCDEQGERLTDIITTARHRLKTGHDIEKPEESHERDEEEHEVPVLDKLVAYDATQLLVAAELAEEGDGGATRSILEIDTVAKVHGESETVYYDEKPLADALPYGSLLRVERQEHEQYVEGIGIGDGGGVEVESAHEDAPPPIVTHKVLVGGVVLEEERQSSRAINDIQQQQIKQ